MHLAEGVTNCQELRSKILSEDKDKLLEALQIEIEKANPDVKIYLYSLLIEIDLATNSNFSLDQYEQAMKLCKEEDKPVQALEIGIEVYNSLITKDLEETENSPNKIEQLSKIVDTLSLRSLVKVTI